MTKGKFLNRWGTVAQFQAPTHIVEGNQLVLRPRAELFCWLLLEILKKPSFSSGDGTAVVKVKQQTLEERTQYSKNPISEAVKELEARLFIKRLGEQRRKGGEFGVNEYIICDPRTGEPLKVHVRQALLFSNSVPYFTVPTCFVKRSDASWSLANLTPSASVITSKAANGYQFKTGQRK